MIMIAFNMIEEVTNQEQQTFYTKMNPNRCTHGHSGGTPDSSTAPANECAYKINTIR